MSGWFGSERDRWGTIYIIDWSKLLTIFNDAGLTLAGRWAEPRDIDQNLPCAPAIRKLFSKLAISPILPFSLFLSRRYNLLHQFAIVATCEDGGDGTW